MKTIQTVRGPILRQQCSMVLSHEHLFIDLTNQTDANAPERPLRPDDHQALMCNPYQLKDNLRLDSYDEALNECQRLLAAGCNTVVDCTTDEIGRNPALLRRLSEESGMNIIMGCGNYTGDTHQAKFLNASLEEAAEHLLHEIRNGIDGIRPGVIGEIGTSKDILPSELKALRVAAKVQTQTRLPIQVHIYPWCQNGLEVIRVLSQEGVPPESIVICHSDVALDEEYIFAMLKQGVWVQMDNFGKEFTPEGNGFAAGRFAKDSERVCLAAKIIRGGFGKQLLLTNDICLKCMLHGYGGQGYDHIFNDIIPLLVQHGEDEAYLKEIILRENPLRLLEVD